MTHNSSVSSLCFEIWFRRRKSQDTYTLKASSTEVKKAWTTDLEKILWDQAAHSRGCNNNTTSYLIYNALTQQSKILKDAVNKPYVPELRMQERVFMGMGRKPFMDIQPSDAAICDRAVSCVLSGRSKYLHTKCIFRTAYIFHSNQVHYHLIYNNNKSTNFGMCQDLLKRGTEELS